MPAKENRTALSACGTIRFHSTYGPIGDAAGVEAIRGLLTSDRKRSVPSRGMFVFDGASRRYEDLYSAEELVATRVKTSATSWISSIAAIRLLSDGETTLKDNVDVDGNDDKTVLHSPSGYAGTKVFFRHAGVNLPLGLTDPDPPSHAMSRCLRDVMEGRDEVISAEADETARLGGLAVVKLSLELANRRRRVTFWVNLEHGAIPIQARSVEANPGTDESIFIQYNCDEVRWADKGWLPFRQFHTQGRISADGAAKNVFVRETVIDEANFREKPDPAAFALEFPREFYVSDADRGLQIREPPCLDADGLLARCPARARRISFASPAYGPAMPDAPEVWKWWPAFYLSVGLACFMLAGTLYRFRRARQHAA